MLSLSCYKLLLVIERYCDDQPRSERVKIATCHFQWERQMRRAQSTTNHVQALSHADSFSLVRTCSPQTICTVQVVDQRVGCSMSHLRRRRHCYTEAGRS